MRLANVTVKPADASGTDRTQFALPVEFLGAVDIRVATAVWSFSRMVIRGTATITLYKNGVQQAQRTTTGDFTKVDFAEGDELRLNSSASGVQVTLLG